MQTEKVEESPFRKLKTEAFGTYPDDWDLGINLVDIVTCRRPPESRDDDDDNEAASSPQQRWQRIRTALRACGGLTVSRYMAVFRAFADWQSNVQRATEMSWIDALRTDEHRAVHVYLHSSARNHGFSCLEDFFENYTRVLAYQLLTTRLFAYSVYMNNYDQSLRSFRDEKSVYFRHHLGIEKSTVMDHGPSRPSPMEYDDNDDTIPVFVIRFIGRFTPCQLLCIGMAF